MICYVYPATQGRPSFQATEVWFDRVNGDASIDYAIRLWMPASTADAFEQEAVPVIRTVHWKVYRPVTVPTYAP